MGARTSRLLRSREKAAARPGNEDAHAHGNEDEDEDEDVHHTPSAACRPWLLGLACAMHGTHQRQGNL
jgi:hypothetical protein